MKNFLEGMRVILLVSLATTILFLSNFYLNKVGKDLTDVWVRSLFTQAEIIATAIAASVTVDTDNTTAHAEKFQKSAPGGNPSPNEGRAPEFSFDPKRVGPLLRRLAKASQLRARIYDRDGFLLLDSYSVPNRVNNLQFDASSPRDSVSSRSTPFPSGALSILRWLTRDTALPVYEDIGLSNGKIYSVVASALEGREHAMAHTNARGDSIISVAAPVRWAGLVQGGLLLTAPSSEIDAIVEDQQFKSFTIIGSTILVSFLATSIILKFPLKERKRF